MRYIMSFLKKS